MLLQEQRFHRDNSTAELNQLKNLNISRSPSHHLASNTATHSVSPPHDDQHARGGDTSDNDSAADRLTDCDVESLDSYGGGGGNNSPPHAGFVVSKADVVEQHDERDAADADANNIMSPTSTKSGRGSFDSPSANLAARRLAGNGFARHEHSSSSAFSDEGAAEDNSESRERRRQQVADLSDVSEISGIDAGDFVAVEEEENKSDDVKTKQQFDAAVVENVKSNDHVQLPPPQAKEKTFSCC